MELVQRKSLRVVFKVYNLDGMRSCTQEEVGDEVARATYIVTEIRR